jgi:hypothetical protein
VSFRLRRTCLWHGSAFIPQLAGCDYNNKHR